MPPDAQPSMSAVSCSIHNARIKTNVCLQLTAPLDDPVKHRTLVSPADILCGSALHLYNLRNKWPVFCFFFVFLETKFSVLCAAQTRKRQQICESSYL
jgi:hypothetical protein